MDLSHIYQEGSVVISTLRMGFTGVRVNIAHTKKSLFTAVFSLSYLLLQGKQQKLVCLNIFMVASNKGVSLRHRTKYAFY